MPASLDTPRDPQHAAYLARRHFGSLDGLRCISILAVIWHHAGEPQTWPILQRGFLGVDMFFVISGFLIVTLLLRERDHRGGISLRDFYARRTLRIFPLYYGVLAALAVYNLTLGAGKPGASTFFHLLPWYVTYMSDWIVEAAPGLTVVWSLAAEEQFYLVWPLCEKILKPRAVWALLGAVLVVNQLINFGVADPWLGGWVGAHRPHLNILQATFTPIALGVVLAHALHARRSFDVLRRVLGGRWAAPLAGLVLLAVWGVPGVEDISGLVRLGVQISMAAFVCACVIREDHPLRGVLAWAPMRRIGAVSYGMYLFHILLYGPAEKVLAMLHLPPAPGRFVVLALLTYGVAEVSFRFYEKPFLHLKARFKRVEHEAASAQ